MKTIINLCAAIILTIAGVSAHAASFNIADGDVAALKAAIVAASGNGEDDDINLATGTYTLTSADNTDGTRGSNGLPVVTADGGHSLTVNGNGAVIMRSATKGTPHFRLLFVGAGANLILNALTLSDGEPEQQTAGGAIFCDHGNVTLVDCTLRNNTASSSDFLTPAEGGAIYLESGTILLLRCTLLGNRASAFVISSGSAYGGAISNRSGTVTAQLCTFSFNTAVASNGQPPNGGSSTHGYGGAIANIFSTGHVAISNCTFNANTAGGNSAQGTTFYTWPNANNVELGNSIVVGDDDIFYGGIVSRGYNLVSGGSSTGLLVNAGDQIGINPSLRPLGYNGGLTPTHAIPPNSPAVDKGKRDTIPSLPATTDQRGAPRPVDYPNRPSAAGGDASDIGSFEVPANVIGGPQSGPVFTVTSVEDHDDGVCENDDCTLREAIGAANAQAGTNTIRFAAGVSGTIRLTSALPNLSTNLTIDGPDANVLTVRRESGGNYRIFTISNGTTTGPIVTLEGLTIANGQGTGSPANGGGIYNDHGALRIEGCSITGNKATNAAGVWCVGGSVTVVDSAIYENVATGFGGAFFNVAVQGNSALIMSNVTVSNNSASRGAAIYNSGPSGAATVTMQNVTVSANTSGQGTIYSDGSTSRVSPRNSIFNPASGSANFINVNGAAVTSSGYNISSDAAGGDGGTGPGGALTHANDRRNTDPKFGGALQSNGGGTPTIALRSDSPAVNAGDHNSAPARDQRGFLRTGTADIGASEFGGTLPVALANLSTRLRVEGGGNVMIGGFIVTGSQPKRLIVRALGPSLPVSGKLADPKLEVYNARGQRIAMNDNWRTGGQEADIIASTIPPPNDLEAAAIGYVDPGAYTAVVSGVNGATGVGIVEVYDLDRTVGSQLANIATRGFVQAGDNVLIAGTIILGQDAQKVIIRAIGPGLGIPGSMADPTLELRNANGDVIRANDNWRTGGQEAEIIASTIPPSNDFEAAIVETLPSNGARYTAVVKGVGNTTGIAVVEVYALN